MSETFEKDDTFSVVEGGSTAMVVDGPHSVSEHRKRLISKYHDGHGGLMERLSASGGETFEGLLIALVNEIVGETDHLLGNELIATEEGSLRDSSVISFKRAEVLEKALKAIQAKQQFERENGLDLDSPAMRVVFRSFMSKVKLTFEMLGYEDEASDVFFRTLGVNMEIWKKELEEELSIDSMSEE